MTLDNFTKRLTRFFSFLYKRKANTEHLLIHYNKEHLPVRQTAEPWDHAKVHIEKLLFEISKRLQTIELSQQQPLSCEKLLNRKAGKYEQVLETDKIAEKEPELPIPSKLPLNIEELQNISAIAKRLRVHSRHRFTN